MIIIVDINFLNTAPDAPYHHYLLAQDNLFFLLLSSYKWHIAFLLPFKVNPPIWRLAFSWHACLVFSLIYNSLRLLSVKTFERFNLYVSMCVLLLFSFSRVFLKISVCVWCLYCYPTFSQGSLPKQLIN